MCELKIDGLAIALDYDDGALARGGTRGDGSVGEDVTPNLRTDAHDSAEAAPQRDVAVPAFLEVRGEVYLRKSDFERLNARARSEPACRSSRIRATPRPAACASSIRR